MRVTLLTLISFALLTIKLNSAYCSEPISLDSLRVEFTSRVDSSRIHIQELKDSYLELAKNHPKRDSIEFEVYEQLQNYFDHQFVLDSAYHYALLARTRLDTNWALTAQHFSGLGVSYFQTEQYEKALSAYDSSIYFAYRDEVFEIIPGLYNRMSVVYNGLRNRTMEIAYLKKGLQLSDSLENIQEKASTLINLGITLYEAKLHDDAILYLNDALKLAGELEDENMKNLIFAYAFANLGNVYGELHMYEAPLLYVDSAEKYVDPRQLHLVGYLNNTKGNAYIELKEYQEANFYLKQAYETFDQLYMVDAKIGSAGHYANALIEIDKIQEAKIICDKTLDIALEQRDFNGLVNLYRALARIAIAEGEKGIADDFLALCIAYKDSAREFSQDEKIAMLRTEYDLSATELENSLLKEQNKLQEISIHKSFIISILASALVVLAFIVMVFLYRNQRKLKKQRTLLHDQNTSLKELNEGNKRLIALISHDIRGPLGVAEQGIQLALESDDETKNLLVKDIQGSLGSMYRLIEGLLNWAKSNNGMSAYLPERLSVSNSVEQTVMLYKHSASMKNIEIKTECAHELNVFADPDMFQTVLRNLLTNAIKFSEKGGRIILSCTQEETWTIISVQDFGKGMTVDQINELESGTLVSTKGSAGEIGTGLGMSLVQSLMKHHNGKLVINSAPEKGTLVSLYFPRA